MVQAAVIEVTAGEQAREIDVLLQGYAARSVECWLDDTWRRCPLAGIPTRTDVLVRFS
jgi:hypothetical protein